MMQATSKKAAVMISPIATHFVSGTSQKRYIMIYTTPIVHNPSILILEEKNKGTFQVFSPKLLMTHRRHPKEFQSIKS